MCDICGKVIENGTTVEPSEHTPGDLENARENSCYLDGYTGDKYCTVCNTQLQQGEVIPKLEHEYEDDVCKNCGRVNNAQLDITYTSKTTKRLSVYSISIHGTGKWKIHIYRRFRLGQLWISLQGR